MPSLVIQQAEPDKEKVGLSNGGHTYIRCSNCEAILMDIFQTMKNAVNPNTGKVFEWKIVASCPFCGDKSFPVDIQGTFHPGGYGKIKHDNEDDDIPSTIAEYEDFRDGIYYFRCVKASPDAKPYRT